MTYAYHWRKAMMTSLCVHILLIIGAGHIMASLPPAVPVAEEVLLEMDLVNSPAEESVSSPAFKESTSLPDMSKSPITETSSVIPVPQTTSRAHEVESVVTSELSMTAAEALDVPSAANQLAHSDSQKTNSNAGSAAVAGGGSKSGIVAPSILSKVDPVYPSAARQAGFQGTVLLKIEILANGRSGEISVARSTGYAALDEAAIAAVEKWRFVPAKERSSGRAVACSTTLPVSFRLHG